MLSISDVGANNAQLQNSQISKTKLWQKLTSQVKPLDLLIYHKAQKELGSESQARSDIDVLIGETVVAMLEGRVNNAPYLAYMGEQVTMTIGEFTDALYFAELSQVRRKAILFALETGMRPEDVVTLTWNMAMRQQFSPLANALIQSQPRHIRLNYVFWEEIDTFGMAGPLFGLSQNFMDAFDGLSPKQVKILYDRSPMIDAFMEGVSFEKVIKDLHD